MPKTEKQRRFLALCSHSDHPPSRCPNREVAREMSHKPVGGYRKSGGKRRK